MTMSSFEGFEKRLELRFSSDSSSSSTSTTSTSFGLRLLPISSINQVLSAVQCTIVSAVGNRSFDSYILSESSLFVYPNKVIIKTCGTTQLLKAIPSLLPHTSSLGLRLSFSRYSRGSFIFPGGQPSPHTSFREEVACLEKFLPSHLSYRKACILPSFGNSRHLWHVHSSAAPSYAAMPSSAEFTVEVCMTDLDRKLAAGFYRSKSDCGLSGDEAGKRMTDASGIRDINSESLVCGFAFEPCGYSMNGLDSDRYSTIHVTPEEGFSYASFECAGGRLPVISEAIGKAVRVFGPGMVSVSVCGAQGQGDQEMAMSQVAEVVESLGMRCRSRAGEELPGAGVVTYQTFLAVTWRK